MNKLCLLLFIGLIGCQQDSATDYPANLIDKWYFYDHHVSPFFGPGRRQMFSGGNIRFKKDFQLVYDPADGGDKIHTTWNYYKNDSIGDTYLMISFKLKAFIRYYEVKFSENKDTLKLYEPGLIRLINSKP
ncbi:MAG: hypothetical protein JXQ87_02745 [Bacteroidia bacterium]